jgi:hypothetical protein
VAEPPVEPQFAPPAPVPDPPARPPLPPLVVAEPSELDEAPSAPGGGALALSADWREPEPPPKASFGPSSPQPVRIRAADAPQTKVMILEFGISASSFC